MLTPRPAVARMQAYHPPLEGRRKFMRLDFNENARGCSPKVIEALRTVDAGEVATYPEYAEFRNKLSEFFGVPQENLLPTNASDEGIQTVFQTFLDPKTELLVPAPTFAMFRFYAELLDIDYREVLYNSDLSFPAERLFAEITPKTRGVVLVNPNNPTGTRIPRETIVRALETMAGRLVLVDEAYVEFSNETVLDLINRYTNLVILRTFSKSFGMAGLRLGTILSCKENIAHMNKAHSPYSISGLTVRLAMAGMEDREYVKAYANDVLRNRDALADALKKMGIETFPSSANFLLARFGGRCKAVEAALREKGILVRDRSSDPLLNGYIRITVGPDDNTQALLTALRAIEVNHG